MARISLTSLLFAVLYTTGALSTRVSKADTSDKTVYTALSSQVRTTVGRTAQLSCRVPDTYFPVKWIRQQTHETIIQHRKKMRVYGATYEAECLQHTDDCILRIKHVQKEDSGFYQCVVDSNPPIRLSVYLIVLDPQTTILGEPIGVHLQASAVNLTCVIQPHPGSDVTVEWLHNGETVMSYAEGHYSIISADTDTYIASYLLIRYAQTTDDGCYTCQPSRGHSDSVCIHVDQVVPDKDYPSVSESQRPRAVALNVGLLVLAVAGAAYSNCCC